MTSAADSILHPFAGEPNDGRSPAGGLTFSPVETVFFGTTRYGGTNNKGTIFRMKPDGSGYTVIHHFAGGPNDGEGPSGELIVVGPKIYGTTFNGGPNNLGTIYRIDTDGAQLTLLHTFPAGTNDGTFPVGPLVLSSSTLYGVSEQGGNDNLGTIFKIDTSGANYGKLHDFVTGTSDGHLPIGGLALVGATLYGTTAQGGTSGNNAGTIFRIDTGGAAYQLLYSFTGSHGDGYNPEHTLTVSGNTLYGVTNQGGTFGTGTIFKIAVNGSGYGVLYSFEGSTGNDGHPASPVTVFKDHLMGTTDPIDINIPDVIYSIGLDGSGFGIIHRFNGGTMEGRDPLGNVVVISSTIYGVTSQGGTGSGVIYALELLKIVSVNHADDGHFVLSGQALPNSSVTTEFSPDLLTDFKFLDTTTADANGVFEYRDNVGIPSASMKFYRAGYQ
ncbi:MAG: choice-of-anchor tandem repeat GloVer-containing protein [Chthoniobacterales bacterium]